MAKGATNCWDPLLLKTKQNVYFTHAVIKYLMIPLLPCCRGVYFVPLGYMLRWRRGISPCYYEHYPQVFFLIENKRKIKPKELPKHLIPCLLVNKLHISAEQVEILVTARSFYFPVPLIPLLS